MNKKMHNIGVEIFANTMKLYYQARDSLLFYGDVTILKDNKEHKIKTIEELNQIIFNLSK